MDYCTHLTIAGVDFKIESALEIVNTFFPAAYGDFSGDAASEHDCSIKVELVAGAQEGVGDLERCFDAGDMWSLFRDGERRFVTHTGGGVESPMWCAEFVPGEARVTVHCGEVLLSSGSIANPVRYPLDQILMCYVLGGGSAGAVLRVVRHLGFWCILQV